MSSGNQFSAAIHSTMLSENEVLLRLEFALLKIRVITVANQ